jgi:hypothetical protein
VANISGEIRAIVNGNAGKFTVGDNADLQAAIARCGGHLEQHYVLIGQQLRDF